MKARFLLAAVAGAVALAAGMAVQAHHDFRAEFDPDAPIVLHGKITGVEWVNPHTWIHLAVSDPGKPDQLWMAEATSPNALLKAGVDRASLAVGTQVTLRGFQAKDKRCLPSAMDHQPTCKVAARALIFEDGRTAITYGPDCGPRDQADTDTGDNCRAIEPIPAGTLDGELIFKARCASCHSPTAKASLRPEQITAALTTGIMRSMAGQLSPAQIQAVVSYISAGGG